MPSIDDIFASARSQQRKLLMPFIVGGWPAGSTGAMLEAMQRAGAAIVEVGIPFSDPIADGPVIAQAMHRALGQGATPASVFDEVRAVRDRLSIGVIAMVSVSIVERMGGPARFATLAKDAGFDGLIVPDCPIEESGAIADAAKAAGLTLTLLIAPTTPAPRAQAIAQRCTGFVYLLARTGITGERADAPEVSPRIARLREFTQLPIACGFGISTPDQVRAVVHPGGADAAIVGSAMVRRVSEAIDTSQNPIEIAEAFARRLAAGLA